MFAIKESHQEMESQQQAQEILHEPHVRTGSYAVEAVGLLHHPIRTMRSYVYVT